MAVPVIELRSDPKQLKRLLDVVAEDQQEFLVNYARRVIREEIRNGFPVEFRTRVDSVLDRRVQDVRPFGRIEYINTSLDITEVIADIPAFIWVILGIWFIFRLFKGKR